MDTIISKNLLMSTQNVFLFFRTHCASKRKEKSTNLCFLFRIHCMFNFISNEFISNKPIKLLNHFIISLRLFSFARDWQAARKKLFSSQVAWTQRLSQCWKMR